MGYEGTADLEGWEGTVVDVEERRMNLLLELERIRLQFNIVKLCTIKLGDQ